MGVGQVVLITAGVLYFGSIFVFGMWTILSELLRLHRQKRGH